MHVFRRREISIAVLYVLVNTRVPSKWGAVRYRMSIPWDSAYHRKEVNVILYIPNAPSVDPLGGGVFDFCRFTAADDENKKKWELTWKQKNTEQQLSFLKRIWKNQRLLMRTHCLIFRSGHFPEMPKAESGKNKGGIWCECHWYRQRGLHLRLQHQRIQTAETCH